MSVHGIGEAADQFHQSRFTGDGDTDLGKFRNKVSFSGTKRQLRQEPKRVKKGGVARRIFQTKFGSVESCRSDVSGVGAGPDQADHLLPFPRSRKPSEPSMTHTPSRFAAQGSEVP